MLNAPFRVAPFFRTRPWGARDLSPWYDYKVAQSPDVEPIGEVWLTGDLCVVETGACAGMTLDQATRANAADLLGAGHANGTQFPLLMKVLFPREKLSVQVHPDDVMAQKYGEPRGKTECWYALDAEEGAEVALGMKPGSTPEAVASAIQSHTLEEMLDWLPVHKGDMFFVDAGTVHAIGPGSVLLETQQNADVTYRLYDYGRPRELHLDKSFEAMRMQTCSGRVPSTIDGDGAEILAASKYFRVERIRFFDGAARARLGAVQMLFCAVGKLVIDGEGFAPVRLERGQLVVIPASCDGWRLKAEAGSEAIRAVAC
ncbi:MAG: type I phosphomannose isomerase catalytic subunit [Acidobacteriaceae bacterium]